MPKRIKLKHATCQYVRFTHQCAACRSFLIEEDIYCPTCGERLEEEEEKNEA